MRNKVSSAVLIKYSKLSWYNQIKNRNSSTARATRYLSYENQMNRQGT